MADPALFLDDGYTLTDSVPASAFHPAVEIVYRPSLAKERNVYQTKLATKDPDVIDKYESELIAKQTMTVAGSPVPVEKARRLHPVIRARLIDLILSFTPALQAAAEANFSGG